MFCKNCGEAIPEDSVFCPMCRAKQDEVEEKEKSGIWSAASSVLEGAAAEMAVEIAQNGMKQMSKAVKKKAGKTMHKVLVGTGLKKANPVDKVEKVIKKIKKMKK